MKSSNAQIDEWILDYLNQEIGDQERQSLDSWVMASEENRSYFRKTCEVWLLSGSERIRDRYNARRAFELFKAEHAGEFASTASTNPEKRRWTTLFRYASIAAVAVLAAILAYWGGNRRGSEKIKGQFADIVVEAPLGSSTRMTLPDGTAVTMNAGSRMVYSQGFGVNDRNIFLSGEGWFEVARNEDLPMIVSSNDIQVRVVGTKFNFRDYPEDLEAIVSLKEGKVALTNKLRPTTSEKFLNPDQRVVLDKHSGTMHIESKDASNAMQWTNGDLFFDEELLSDIAKELERYYDVKITILGDNLRNLRIYGHFVRREMSIEDILDMLSATNKIDYTVKDGVITMREHQKNK